MELQHIRNRLKEEGLLLSSSELERGISIHGITSDSREIDEGDLFIAIPGDRVDGHEFIPDAVEAGASAIVCEHDMNVPDGTPSLIVRSSRSCEGYCADEFYGRPSSRMTVFGVTGTNGKTTTSHLIYELLEEVGEKTGLVGTIRNRIGERSIPSDRTTPTPCKLHSLLDQMAEEGCSCAVLEVSSHGLDQERVNGVLLDVAVFTNLSRDHLDYHEDMESYSRAKQKLFQLLPESGTGIINRDNKYGSDMMEACNGRVITYGLSSDDVDYGATIYKSDITGSEWSLQTKKEEHRVEWTLPGRHNIENALASVAAVHELTDYSLDRSAAGLETVSPVDGRLDPVSSDDSVRVYVDYAHTPDALKNVLNEIQPLVSGNLRAVFGCGGDRDRGKRPKMGKIVDERADDLYITSDNPRSEDPEQIIEDILEGIDHPENHYIHTAREQAIEQSVIDAEPGDVILILGKGHETVQEKDGVVRPFEDRAVAKEALKKHRS